MADPARGGRLMTLEDVIAAVVREYGVRNRTYIQWADEKSTEVIPDVATEPDDDEDTEDVDPDSD